MSRQDLQTHLPQDRDEGPSLCRWETEAQEALALSDTASAPCHLSQAEVMGGTIVS